MGQAIDDGLMVVVKTKSKQKFCKRKCLVNFLSYFPFSIPKSQLSVTHIYTMIKDFAMMVWCELFIWAVKMI